MFSRRTAWRLTENDFTRAISSHRAAGRELLDLTVSNPTVAGLRYDGQAILAALANSAALTYTPNPKGLFSARAAVAGYYRQMASAIGHDELEKKKEEEKEEDAAVDPESVVLTVSSSEAYSFLFRLLCDPGDEVLIPRPSYPLFEYLAELHDARLAPYSLFYDHGWHIDVHSLRVALTARSRAIIVVHPNNPTGSYVHPQETAQLNALCAAHNLALVADEVFFDYSLREQDGTGPRSFAFNRDALTFTLNGVSKISGLPQMKLAWIVTGGPRELAEPALERLEVIADTYLSMNAPIQLAAPALLDQRHSIREQLVARMHANLVELDRQLQTQSLCSRLEVEGGWYAMLRAPATRSDEELAIALLERTNVLAQPGYFYDFPQEGYLVLSLIAPESDFQEGLRRILGFVQEAL